MKKAVWVFLALVFVLPLAYILLLSVATNWRYPRLLPEALHLDNWRYITQTELGWSFLYSVFVSACVASISTVSGFFVGKAIAAHPKRDLFLTISYFPYAFSPVVYAFCLNFMFIRLGLTGSTLGVIVAQFIITFPFVVLMSVNHWSHALLQLENLVFTLGGSPRQAFWRVLLPLSKSILLLCFFQTFIISWFEYGLTAVIGLGKVQTLTLKTYQYIGESNIYFAALASMLLVFPPLVMVIFNRRFRVLWGSVQTSTKE